MGKYVFNLNEGSKEMRHILGGKGANLAEMTKIGLPVPPGFTVSADACRIFYQKGKILWDDLVVEIHEQLCLLEKQTGKKFGDGEQPLLVSVRSGAVVSMPGMMDTILNLGLNDITVEALSNSTGNHRFAYDSYRRFIQMFSDVVMGIPKYKFDREIDAIKQKNNYNLDTELTTEDLKALIASYKRLYEQEQKEAFPTKPHEQLMLAIKAVFDSWDNPRANVYRKLHEIDHRLGTAVNIQAMVFGNMGESSGTGVAFTRNPSTGDKIMYGEFLMNAQGEDVVAGIRTPYPITELERLMPEVYHELIETATLLEDHYGDMQDIEFTIENKQLYLLQTRAGKRTAKAAVKIAVDLVSEGKISKEEAILRIEAKQLDQLLHPTFEEGALAQAQIVARGLPASPGTASGKVCFNAESVLTAREQGEQTILVRVETSPEDIEGMAYAEGILTSRGGITSHAAVVARGMGKCCVVGCSEINVDEENKVIHMEGLTVFEGDWISLDGSTGTVYLGDIQKVEGGLSDEYTTFMSWVDEIRTLKVRANADSVRDAKAAIQLGAEGIGLCRTEHMFFEEARIAVVRKMILSRTVGERKKALLQLLPIQEQDFIAIFTVMNGLPCTIRLLDPPLHEFLPKEKAELHALASQMELPLYDVMNRVSELTEINPMLGHRGCRLAITYPEIYEMQVEAIIHAALAVQKMGIIVEPEIMVPLIGDQQELHMIKELLVKKAETLIEQSGLTLNYKVGTMIEVPRAALLADQIAKEAAFFSFGTNDLTQMTYGFSRDDSNKFIKEYESKQIIEKDPFQTLDQSGVGKLIQIAVELGRRANPNLKIGICGEHGGDPKSIAFFYRAGLDYVSCSPYRVPIARLAAAQSALQNKSLNG
jgi:pyruvate, orthophosphate dikinase